MQHNGSTVKGECVCPLPGKVKQRVCVCVAGRWWSQGLTCVFKEDVLVGWSGVEVRWRVKGNLHYTHPYSADIFLPVPSSVRFLPPLLFCSSRFRMDKQACRKQSNSLTEVFCSVKPSSLFIECLLMEIPSESNCIL